MCIGLDICNRYKDYNTKIYRVFQKLLSLNKVFVCS